MQNHRFPNRATSSRDGDELTATDRETNWRRGDSAARVERPQLLSCRGVKRKRVTFLVTAKKQVATGQQRRRKIDVVRIKGPLLGSGRGIEGTDARCGLGAHCHCAATVCENSADIVIGGVP